LYDYYAGKLYTLPYDGDVLSLYFRKDIFNDETEKSNFKKAYNKELAPPETWDEMLDIAKFFTRKSGETLAGKKLDEDFYGFAFLAQRGSFAFAWWLAEFASRGGKYFDKDMNPMINSEEGVIALQRLIDSLPAKLLSDDFSIDDVSTPDTGLDPYRKSHFNNPGAFSGFAPEKEALEYLAAIDNNLTYGFPDLSLPGSAEYIDVLELNLGKAYTKDLSPKEALDAVAKEWDSITDRLGRANQIRIYGDLLQSWKEVGLID